MRSPRSTDAISPLAVSPDQEPAEVPVTVNYAGMPAAGSPPHSAKSVKDAVSPFKFNYRDSIRRYDRKSPPTAHAKPAPQASSLSQMNAEPSVSQEIRPISPPSNVQAKIRQFQSRERQRPISPPVRDRHRPTSPPRPAYTKFPAVPPVPISKPPLHVTDKFRQKPDSSDQKTLKSPTSNGESGRFSPASTISTESSLSSSSSVATVKASASGGFSQAYVSSLGSSDESLTESSALLKDEEKITSPAALCIYFDKKGYPDTLV